MINTCTWQFETPDNLGRTESRSITNSKGVVTDYQEFVPNHIMTYSKCGKKIWSYWMPDQERWHAYAKNESPVAWLVITDPVIS